MRPMNAIVSFLRHCFSCFPDHSLSVPVPLLPVPPPGLPAPASPLSAPSSSPASPLPLYPIPSYIFIDTLAEANHYLGLILDGDIIGLDLESVPNPNHPNLSKAQKRQKRQNEVRDAATFTIDWAQVEVCVIQIATVGGAVYVIHLRKIAALPVEFVRICQSPRILKVAAGIFSDGQRLWDNFRLNLYCAASLGLASVLAYPKDLNPHLPYGNEPGLRPIIRHVLHYDLSKDLQVSPWDSIPLSEQQRDYAAADVHATLASYRAIQSVLQGCGFVVNPNWYRYDIVKRVRVKEGIASEQAWSATCPWWSAEGIYMGCK
ncbi:ribonuclease H-like domain-containing protein [Mycena olivaceomarginata]|nr:ribonuclease H-like domain-containing protein [Mycena olivaceomarginata]